MKLYAHQKEGVKYVLNNLREGHGSILAFDMGLGKTITTLVVLGSLFKSGYISHALLIIPRVLIPTWLGEIQKIFPGENVQVYTNKKKPLEDVRFIITTYDLLKRPQVHEHIINKLGRYVLVGDEAHEYCTKTRSGRWKALVQLKPVATVLLTGTPIYNKIEDLYALMALTHKKLAGTKAAWCDKFIELKDLWVKRKPYKSAGEICRGRCIYHYKKEVEGKFWWCYDCGQGYVKTMQVAGYKEENIPALHKMLKSVMLRKLKEECLDLPPKKIVYLPYDLNHTKSHYNQYDQERVDLETLHILRQVLSGSYGWEK